MNAIKAIFNKQLADLPKNISVSMMFVMFPAISLLFGFVMGEGDPAFAAAMNVQFGMIFASMTPMVMIGNAIAEDNEYKALRFMVTAGVKPVQYLAGLISFTMIISIFPILAFAFIGGYPMPEVLIFIGLVLLGCLASSIIGAIVGIFSKNVQQASAIYTPLGMVFAFMPMLALFSDTIRTIAFPLFSVQIFVALMDVTSPPYIVQGGGYFDGVWVPNEVPYEAMSLGLPIALAIIGANVLVFGVLFAIAYKKKGLRG